MDTIKVTLRAKGYEGIKGQLASVVETPTGVVYRVEVFRKGIDLAPRVIGFTADAVRLPRGFVPAIESPTVVLVYRGRTGNTVRFTDAGGNLVKLSWDGKANMRRRAYKVSSDRFGVITSFEAA
jgi:YD repeat-containing protein